LGPLFKGYPKRFRVECIYITCSETPPDKSTLFLKRGQYVAINETILTRCMSLLAVRVLMVMR